MSSIEQTSQTYLGLVVAAERKHRMAHPCQDPSLMISRFWDARSIAKEAGIDDSALREVVRHLSAKDLLHWRDKTGRNPTVHLTVKGFSEPVPPVLPPIEKPTVQLPRRIEGHTLAGPDLAAVAVAAIALIVGSSGVALVFLSRVALVQDTGESSGLWKAVAGVVCLFVGGLLLGASLPRAYKALASPNAPERGSEPEPTEA